MTKYKVKKKWKTIAKYDNYDDAANFLEFLVMVHPFCFDYHITYKGKVIV